MDLLSRGSLATFCYLVPFWGLTSPSLRSWTDIFFFRSGMAFSPRSMGIGRKGGGRVRGTLDLGTSCEVVPLFLQAIRFLRLLFSQFNVIASSSSLEVLSRWTTIRAGKWTLKCLSASSLAFEMLTMGASWISPSLKWNLSISSSSDRWEKETSFLYSVTASGKTYWSGNITGGRSLRAKNPDLETSMRFNLGSPALIAWPAS